MADLCNKAMAGYNLTRLRSLGQIRLQGQV